MFQYSGLRVQFQVMMQFFELETAEVLRRLLPEGWIRWAGPPVEVLLDPATTNMAESMTLQLRLTISWIKF
jgi:hypothetical protein